jgi:hypothetical protein
LDRLALLARSPPPAAATLQIVRECFFALMGLRGFVFETDDKTNLYMLRADVAVTSLSPRALRNALLDTIRLANDLAKLRDTAARLTGACLSCNLGGSVFKDFDICCGPGPIWSLTPLLPGLGTCTRRASA